MFTVAGYHAVVCDAFNFICFRAVCKWGRGGVFYFLSLSNGVEGNYINIILYSLSFSLSLSLKPGLLLFCLPPVYSLSVWQIKLVIILQETGQIETQSLSQASNGTYKGYSWFQRISQYALCSSWTLLT